MAWNGFGRTLLFGALAGAGWPVVALALGPIFEPHATLCLYLMIVSAAYVAGLGERPRRALASGMLGLAAGALVLLVEPGLAVCTVAAAALVGVGRARAFGPSRPARQAVLEFGTIGLGLLVARTVAAPDALAIALALWSFFLIQSLYFLVADVAPRPHLPPQVDPFDLAQARAEALLGDRG